MNMTPAYAPVAPNEGQQFDFGQQVTPPSTSWTPEHCEGPRVYQYLGDRSHHAHQPFSQTPVRPRDRDHQPTPAIEDLKKEVDSLKAEVAALRQKVGDKSQKQRKKLPPELSVKVRNLHSNLENQFIPSEEYRSSRNQQVARELCEQLLRSDTVDFTEGVIKRAVYRYYESRRKIFNDSQPRRRELSAMNKKNSRKSQERRRLFDRRAKVVKLNEASMWNLLTPSCMSEESDNEEGTKTRHTPLWRSQRLNAFMQKLDNRITKKMGIAATRRIPRVYGALNVVPAPPSLPHWMIVQDQPLHTPAHVGNGEISHLPDIECPDGNFYRP